MFLSCCMLTQVTFAQWYHIRSLLISESWMSTKMCSEKCFFKNGHYISIWYFATFEIKHRIIKFPKALSKKTKEQISLEKKNNDFKSLTTFRARMLLMIRPIMSILVKVTSVCNKTIQNIMLFSSHGRFEHVWK